MEQRVLRALALLLMLTCLLPAAQARTVAGVIKDKGSNLPVSNVVVKILQTGDSTQTDASGYYVFPNVADGSYTFLVGKSTYVPTIMTSVAVGSCCVGTTGNVNNAGVIDLSDLSMLIAYLTATPKPTLPCAIAANVNKTGVIDLSDLSLLIAYLTASPRPTLPACP